jgi:uncharacterized protein YjiS (DUF1127 family)
MCCRFVSINFLVLSVTRMPILSGNQCTRVTNSVAPGPAFRLAEGGNVVKAATLRIPAIFRLPAIWWQRVHFRARLRADIAEAADFLHDIGINLFEAQAEAVRFFWEPITLMRLQPTPPEVAPGLATDVDLRSDPRMRGADSARAVQLESKADLEVS